MYESISKNNELENEMTLDMSYFWYSDEWGHTYLDTLWHTDQNPGIWIWSCTWGWATSHITMG